MTLSITNSNQLETLGPVLWLNNWKKRFPCFLSAFSSSGMLTAVHSFIFSFPLDKTGLSLAHQFGILAVAASVNIFTVIKLVYIFIKIVTRDSFAVLPYPLQVWGFWKVFGSWQTVLRHRCVYLETEPQTEQERAWCPMKHEMPANENHWLIHSCFCTDWLYDWHS